MPIQFRCESCRQPIEVDDGFGGRTAACPYCRALVQIPLESSYAPDEVVAARGVSGRPRAAPRPRSAAARGLGSLALVCAAALVSLTIVALARGCMVVSDAGLFRYTGAPPDFHAIDQAVNSDPWIGPISGAALLAAVIGLGLAAAALVQQPRGDWRTWTSLAVCGLYVGLNCVGLLVIVSRALADGS